MKRYLLSCAAALAAVLVLSAAAPPVPDGPHVSALAPISSAHAQATKSRGDGAAGGGNVTKAGDRLGELLSGWAVPVLTVIAGCLLIGALASRNIGSAVGIVVITMLGLIFLLTPESIQTLAKGISSFVF
jgi:hypothetical protein